VLFKYYDFDEDGLVGTEDVSMMLLLMGGNPDTCNLMASYLLQQFDGDKDGKLNFTEFQTVAEYFVYSFCFRKCEHM
jgi:Ca2+-binding EF-hand superfamily protein